MAAAPGDRRSFVARDPAREAGVRAQVQAGRPVLFLPVDVAERTVRGCYQLLLYGPAADGSKCLAVLSGAPVYFDVALSAGGTAAEIWALLQPHGLAPRRVAPLEQRPLFGYENPARYVRVFLGTPHERRRSIQVCHSAGRATASDDPSAHYRKVARDLGLSLTSWLVLSKYRARVDPAEAPQVRYELTLAAADARTLVDPFREPDAAARELAQAPQCTRDRTLVMTFDIETYGGGGRLPRGHRPGDVVFMVCCTAHWRCEPEPLAAVCITTCPVPEDPRWATLHCHDQAGLIRAFGQTVRRWAPDIITGFNDMGYDWPFLMEKAGLLGLQPELLRLLSAGDRAPSARWNWREGRVKLGDEDCPALVRYPHVPGWVPLDVRLLYMRLHPKSERSSLAHFLALANLAGKVDMPYSTMWRHYEAGDAEGLRAVAWYCLVDARRCQELLLRRNLVGELRDVGHISFTCLQDCMLYAGGHKVCNMLAAYAGRAGYLCSLRRREQEGPRVKYPGAYVVHPRQGLERDEPVTGLDFASLYPSIIMAYNLSPERFVAGPEQARALAAAGRELHHVRFEHAGGVVEGWFVRHGGADAEMGLFPRVLIDLFGKRKALKRQLKAMGEELERRGADGAPAGAYAGLDDAELAFRHAAVDSRQKAVKVFMNTFYGEAGNAASPLFLLPLAGGVTAAGRYNLQKVVEYVQGRGFGVRYGDSVAGDSALVLRRAAAPDRIFTARIDELVPAEAWRSYNNKEAADTPGLEVWQDTGFTPVRRVIRHAHGRPLVRILTHTGLVDCTRDHSLLLPDGQEVRPAEVKLGCPLLHAAEQDVTALMDAADRDKLVDPACGRITEAEAFAMGLFAADGSCGVYQSKWGVKHSWAINNQDLSLLRRAQKSLPFGSKILDTLKSSGVYKLVPVGDFKTPTRRYRRLFYNQHREKKIPPEILGADLDTALEFWYGFYAGDGDKAKKQSVRTHWRISQKGKEMATGLWLLGQRLGWQVSINARPDKNNVFRLTFCDSRHARPPHEVKKKWQLPSPGTVYDLETASHHFHVGPGNLVVHNTDSVYVTCPPGSYPAWPPAQVGADRAAAYERHCAGKVREAMRQMAGLRDDVNAMLRADNRTGFLRMAYEEVLLPALFAGKKKYFGRPHETIPNFRAPLFVRGIDTVKRGQSAMARRVGEQVMEEAMRLVPPDEARPTMLEIVETRLRRAIAGADSSGLDDFVKTASWRPDRQNQAVQQFMARMRPRHAAELAENRARAAAGLAPLPLLYAEPEPGARFSYVLVEPSGPAYDLQGRKVDQSRCGDRMEYLRVAREQGLRVDVSMYLTGAVLGICARFLGGEPRFCRGAPAGQKAADLFAQKEARRHLGRLLAQLRPGRFDAAEGRRRQKAYRAALGRAPAGVRNAAEGPLPALLQEDPVDEFMDRARQRAEGAGLAPYLAAALERAGVGPGGTDVGGAGSENLYRLGRRLALRPPRGEKKKAVTPAQQERCRLLQRQAAVRQELQRTLAVLRAAAVHSRGLLQGLVRQELGGEESGPAAAHPALARLQRLWDTAGSVFLEQRRAAALRAKVAALKAARAGKRGRPDPGAEGREAARSCSCTFEPAP